MGLNTVMTNKFSTINAKTSLDKSLCLIMIKTYMLIQLLLYPAGQSS